VDVPLGVVTCPAGQSRTATIQRGYMQRELAPPQGLARSQMAHEPMQQGQNGFMREAAQYITQGRVRHASRNPKPSTHPTTQPARQLLHFTNILAAPHQTNESHRENLF
jgi:hypothetical protein